MIQVPPAYSAHLGGTTGPHLGPRQPWLAYQPLPCGRGIFHQGIFPHFLHLDSEAILQIVAHRLIIPRPVGSMAQVSPPLHPPQHHLTLHPPHPMTPELYHRGHCSLLRKVVEAAFQGHATSASNSQHQGRSTLPQFWSSRAHWLHSMFNKVVATSCRLPFIGPKAIMPHQSTTGGHSWPMGSQPRCWTSGWFPSSTQG